MMSGFLIEPSDLGYCCGVLKSDLREQRARRKRFIESGMLEFSAHTYERIENQKALIARLETAKWVSGCGE